MEKSEIRQLKMRGKIEQAASKYLNAMLSNDDYLVCEKMIGKCDGDWILVRVSKRLEDEDEKKRKRARDKARAQFYHFSGRRFASSLVFLFLFSEAISAH